MEVRKEEEVIEDGKKGYWMRFSQEELDDLYSPSRWSKKFGKDVIIGNHAEETRERTGEAKKIVQNRLDVTYDPSLPRGKLDVYGEDLDGASPVVVYLHGGYWQALSKEQSGYLVPPLYKAGAVVVVVGYDLAPQVGVADIVKEVRKGLAWACEFASTRGSKGVVLVGFSAGAQIVSQILSEEDESGRVQTEITPYRHLVRGFASFSGVFDVRPLVYIYANDALKLNNEGAWAVSPLRTVGNLAKVWGTGGRGGKGGGGGGGGGRGLQLLLFVAEQESPEYKRQSKEYFDACVDHGLLGEFVEVEDADHFSLPSDLFLPTHLPTKRLIAFVHSCCDA